MFAKYRALAEQYRKSQSALLRVMLVEFNTAWGRYEQAPPGELSEQAWTATVAQLVDKYGQASATLAADYYDEARQLAGLDGDFDVPIADPPPLEQILASRRWSSEQARKAAQQAAEQAITAGTEQTAIDEARQGAERRRKNREREAAAAQRLAAQAGRRTIEQATRQDPQAQRWQRVPEPGCCAFCAMLALRGAVYDSRARTVQSGGSGKQKEGDPYHDHCNCQPVPVFRGQSEAWREEFDDWQDLYDEATRDHSGKAKLDAFRRAFKERYGADARPDTARQGPEGADERAGRSGPEHSEARDEGPIPAHDKGTADAPLLDVDDAEATERVLEELEQVPPGVFDQVLAFLEEADGGGISVGDKPLTQLRGGELLGGVPRGWPEGSSWDDVAGVYIPGLRRLLVNSSGASASGSVMLHEFGHATDAAYDGASHQRKWRTLHTLVVKVLKKRPGYNSYYDHPEEWWAEAFAAWARGPDALLTASLGDEQVAKLLSKYFDDVLGGG